MEELAMSTPVSPTDQAAPGVEVVLLTTDLEFRDVAMAAAGDQRPVYPVLSLSEALTLISERQPGVLIMDTESLGPNPKITLERLRRAALDLVILLAGDREGKLDLMEFVDSGEIFRAILRPANPGQTGLCIQAAAERHIELLMGSQRPAATVAEPLPQDKPFGERRRVSLAAPVVGLALAAVTYTLMPEREPQPEPAVPEPAPRAIERADETARPMTTTEQAPARLARGSASGVIVRQPDPLDPEVELLLNQGETALAAGRLTAPAPANAADKFRAAIALAPDNERARAGLDRVADGLAAGAAAALLEGRDEDAAQLVDEALGLKPESPQLAYLTRQISQERGRRLLAEAQEAADANDFQTTVTRLDEAATLLDADISAQAYAALDPFLARSEAELAEGNVARAEGILEQVVLVVPDHPRIAPLERAIADRKYQRAVARKREAQEASMRAAEDARVQERVDALLAAAAASTDAGRLVGEGDDNTLAQLRAARALKPEDPAVLAGLDELTSALLGRADAALEVGDYDAAERWTAEAGVIGYSAERVAAARDRIDLARRMAISNTVVPASELNRVAYVAPEYPGRAWRLGVEGWVDVEFDVTRDGETTSIIVVGAERKGYFEDAVLEAVSQWRYEPRVYAGAPIDQRVKLRISFERKLD
jgi:TonB family protein